MLNFRLEFGTFDKIRCANSYLVPFVFSPEDAADLQPGGGKIQRFALDPISFTVSCHGLLNTSQKLWIKIILIYPAK